MIFKAPGVLALYLITCNNSSLVPYNRALPEQRSVILERMEAVLDIFTLIDFPFWGIFTPRGKGDFMIQSVKTYMHQGVPNKSKPD